MKRVPRVVRGSSIAVAFSGGKDSTVLLHLLYKYRKHLRIKNIYSVTLMQEIPKAQQEQKYVLSYAKRKYPDVNFIQKSFTDLFGYSLGSLVEISDDRNLKFTPCAICGVLKRNGIMRLAMDFKVDYLAFGNTLEDEVETIFLNIMRNQPQRNYRNLVKYRANDGCILPERLKPLIRMSETDIELYKDILGLKSTDTQCPYRTRSLRSELNPFVRHLRSINPHVLYNTVASVRCNEEFKNAHHNEVLVQKCNDCGFYSKSAICSACGIISQITR